MSGRRKYPPRTKAWEFDLRMIVTAETREDAIVKARCELERLSNADESVFDKMRHVDRRWHVQCSRCGSRQLDPIKSPAPGYVTYGCTKCGYRGRTSCPRMIDQLEEKQRGTP